MNAFTKFQLIPFLLIQFFLFNQLQSGEEQADLVKTLQQDIELYEPELAEDQIEGYLLFEEADPAHSWNGQQVFALIELKNGERFPAVGLFNEKENTLKIQNIPSGAADLVHPEENQWLILWVKTTRVEQREQGEERRKLLRKVTHSSGSFPFTLKEDKLFLGKNELQLLEKQPKLVLPDE